MPTSIREIQMGTRGARRGTIRGGELVNGKPTKRETWLLTSPDDAVLKAMPFDGEVLPYSAQGEKSNDRWQLDTGTDVLRVKMSAYGSPLTQRYELYGSGGLVRDCDGINVKTVDPETGEMIEQTCLCSDERRDCKLASRLSVILADAATFGSWLLTTGSENAAYELTFAVNMLMEAERVGATVPAILRLEQRTIKKQGEKFPRRFAVPVLDADPIAIRALESGAPERLALEAPVPAALPAAVEPGITEQTPPPVATISQAQIGRLMAVAREHDVSTEDLKLVVLSEAGVKSRKDIPVAKYDDVIKAIESVSGELVKRERQVEP